MVPLGVGEAGSNPPSHSIIADLYPPAERSTAMAIFGTGVNIGIMLGYLIGGWINEWLDWRWAFVVAGLPGLVIAVIVRFTITKTGSVRDPIVAESSSSIFERSALKAVAQYKYEPLVVNGEPQETPNQHIRLVYEMAD